VKDGKNSILEQLRRNTVALISLVVAISSLSYNTWRNEATEENRNLRVAAFEILLKLGELQQVVFHSHYDKDLEKGNPRTGWAYALTIRDLARVLPAPMPGEAEALLEVWGDNWVGLGDEQQQADAIMSALEHTRNETLSLLQSLD
jgi:hypothetical protein